MTYEVLLLFSNQMLPFRNAPTLFAASCCMLVVTWGNEPSAAGGGESEGE